MENGLYWEGLIIRSGTGIVEKRYKDIYDKVDGSKEVGVMLF